MNSPLYYEKMTAPQLQHLVEGNSVILLSFGSIEQHSTHLPVGTDTLCSLKRVEAIATRTDSVILSPLLLGYSFNHVGMMGTISLKAETMLHVVIEILEQLCNQGWVRFIVFSGHSGNWNVLELAIQIVRETHPCSQFVVARGVPPLTKQHSIKRFINNFDRHAGKIETALISFYFPECLDKSRIPEGNKSLPPVIMKHIQNERLDEIDELLINAYTPQKTDIISHNGNWGIQNPNEYQDIPVAEAMRNYEDFFVTLILRWNEWEIQL